jgi:hypothetical protein
MVHARWLMGLVLGASVGGRCGGRSAGRGAVGAGGRGCGGRTTGRGGGEPTIVAQDSLIREQTIYVPYNKLRQVFEQQGRGVFLPYEQFQELWKRAQETLRAEPDRPSPVPALITEIDSEATVGQQVVSVTARLTLELLSEGWHEIPLRLADASIQSAQLGEQPARLLMQPAGYSLLVHKKGDQPETQQLMLQYSKAFTKSPGQNRLTLQAPQAPVNRWPSASRNRASR